MHIKQREKETTTTTTKKACGKDKTTLTELHENWTAEKWKAEQFLYYTSLCVNDYVISYYTIINSRQKKIEKEFYSMIMYYTSSKQKIKAMRKPRKTIIAMRKQ